MADQLQPIHCSLLNCRHNRILVLYKAGKIHHHLEKPKNKSPVHNCINGGSTSPGNNPIIFMVGDYILIKSKFLHVLNFRIILNASYFQYGGIKLSASNKILIFVFLAALSMYISLYTISAHHVADRWVINASWRYSGNMTFFPWPKGPQGILLPIITRMNPIDEFIYLYLIKTGILILVCLGLWATTIIYFFKAILPLIKAWKLTRSQARVML